MQALTIYIMLQIATDPYTCATLCYKQGGLPQVYHCYRGYIALLIWPLFSWCVCVSPALIHAPQPSFVPCPWSCSCMHNPPPTAIPTLYLCPPAATAVAALSLAATIVSSHTHAPLPPPPILLLLQQQWWLCSLLSHCLHCCSPCTLHHLYAPLFMLTHAHACTHSSIQGHPHLWLLGVVHTHLSRLSSSWYPPFVWALVTCTFWHLSFMHSGPWFMCAHPACVSSVCTTL